MDRPPPRPQDPENNFTPGDLGFDPLGFSDNGINPDYALAEIKHARLAMLGALGMLFQVGTRPVVCRGGGWGSSFGWLVDRLADPSICNRTPHPPPQSQEFYQSKPILEQTAAWAKGL